MQSQTNSYTKSFSIDQERENYHNKMKKRKLSRLSVVVFIWILVITYFILPFSKIGDYQINGNVFIDEEEIRTILHIDSKMLIFLFDKSNGEELLNANSYIKTVNIKKKFFKMIIEIEEIYPVAQFDDKLLLNNKILMNKDDYLYQEKLNSIPFLNGDIDDTSQPVLYSNLAKVDTDVLLKMKNIQVIKKGVEESNYYICDIEFFDEKIGYMMIRVDLSKLDFKFRLKYYNFIINHIEKEKEDAIMYPENDPVYVRYDLPNNIDYIIVESFS